MVDWSADGNGKIGGELNENSHTPTASLFSVKSCSGSYWLTTQQLNSFLKMAWDSPRKTWNFSLVVTAAHYNKQVVLQGHSLRTQLAAQVPYLQCISDKYCNKINMFSMFRKGAYLGRSRHQLLMKINWPCIRGGFLLESPVINWWYQELCSSCIWRVLWPQQRPQMSNNSLCHIETETSSTKK